MKVYKVGDTAYEIHLDPDNNPQQPDEYNDALFLVYNHRDFAVRNDEYNLDVIWQELNSKHIPINFEHNGYYLIPVYAYIHSGVSLSLYRGTDHWDTSFKGFMFANKKEFESRDKAIEAAQSLIGMWNQYLGGDVYQAELVKAVTCECCGYTHRESDGIIGNFYGDDIFTNGVIGSFDLPDELKDFEFTRENTVVIKER